MKWLQFDKVDAPLLTFHLKTLYWQIRLLHEKIP